MLDDAGLGQLRMLDCVVWFKSNDESSQGQRRRVEPSTLLILLDFEALEVKRRWYRTFPSICIGGGEVDKVLMVVFSRVPGFQPSTLFLVR
jgi:hypothetical protein